MSTRVASAFSAIEQSQRPEIWTSLRQEEEVMAEAQALESLLKEGKQLPLAGLVCAVKDNIDVAGLLTTAGSRSYAYKPRQDAECVAQLRAAGAIVLGKTNLDQFATGLVGTRSPFGPVRNAWDESMISGGSSSGSAVAVALGLVDFALGTDTAGSGRVPAALNGIYGIKPTPGMVSTTGVVPACQSIDCVSVFAREFVMGQRVMSTLCSPTSQQRTSHGEHATPVKRQPEILIPLQEQLGTLAPGWLRAFVDYGKRVQAAGFVIREVDITPLLDAAPLLYGSALVAERYVAVGGFITANQELVGGDLDPVVADIITRGAQYSAFELLAAQAAVEALKTQSADILTRDTVLLTPTTTRHPSFAEVATDPVGVNSDLGRFTNFCNLFGYASLAIPAGHVDGLPFGVMLTGSSYSDATLAEIAYRVQPPALRVFVVGAHRRGQPLNSELVASGGQFIALAHTAPKYRLFALATTPPKPGLVRQAEGGDVIEGEVWELPAAGFGAFVAGLPQPMSIGKIELADGSDLPGFVCESVALPGALEITQFGSWLTWLNRGHDEHKA